MKPFSAIAKFAKQIFNSGVANPARWLVDWAAGGERSTSGERVNERTALGLSAYLACIKNISEDVGKLPFDIYKRLTPRGRQEMPEHPVDYLLSVGNSTIDPYPDMSAMTFRETLTAHALGWQGGFAEIVRNDAGVPMELHPLDPTTVQVLREMEGERRIYYMVSGVRLEKSQVFHIHGLGYDGLTGYILARIAKDPIGNALAAQKFAGSFFANGTVSTGVIEVPAAMTDTAFKHLRESFHARHGGGENAHKPIILEGGAKWSTTSTEPEKSQMVEVLYHGVEEVARLFRMPLHKIGHLQRSTNNNIEQQALEYFQDTLMAWLCRWEAEVCRKLLSRSERKTLYAKFCINALLRGDVAARSAFYTAMRNIGVYSANDIREKEDDNPIEDGGGDTYLVQTSYAPLEMIAEGDHLPINQPDAAGSGAVEPPQTHPEPAARVIEHVIKGAIEYGGKVDHDHSGNVAHNGGGAIDIGGNVGIGGQLDIVGEPIEHRGTVKMNNGPTVQQHDRLEDAFKKILDAERKCFAIEHEKKSADWKARMRDKNYSDEVKKAIYDPFYSIAACVCTDEREIEHVLDLISATHVSHSVSDGSSQESIKSWDSASRARTQSRHAVEMITSAGKKIQNGGHKPNAG